MVPLPDFNQLFQMLTVNAKLGPPQFAVIAVTIFVVKFLKDSPKVPTPKKWRPYLYLGVGVVLNVALEFVLGVALDPKTLVAEQIIIWATTLGIRHLVDAPKPEPQDNADPRDGRFGDPRRP